MNRIIDMLKLVVCFTQDEYEEKQKVIAEAKVLVDKATPKQVEYNPFGRCPTCNNILILNGGTYCQYCGQRLKR